MYNFFRMEMNSGTFLGYFLQAVPITIAVGIVYSIFRAVLLKCRQCPVKWVSEIVRLLFVCYLTGLCSLVILPANFWLHVYDGISFGWWESMEPFFRLGEINLEPTLVKCLSGEFSLGGWVKDMLVGNIAMFLPFGFFLPFVVEKLNRRNAFLISLAAPLVVESLQVFVGRSFDIDDLICNFLGIMIGFVIAGGVKRLGELCNKAGKRNGQNSEAK